jgi:hypothetical protein
LRLTANLRDDHDLIHDALNAGHVPSNVFGFVPLLFGHENAFEGHDALSATNNQVCLIQAAVPGKRVADQL